MSQRPPRKPRQGYRHAAVVYYVLAMVAVIVAVDVLDFRHQFLLRLLSNIGIVLVFAASYFIFLKRR